MLSYEWCLPPPYKTATEPRTRDDTHSSYVGYVTCCRVTLNDLLFKLSTRTSRDLWDEYY